MEIDREKRVRINKSRNTEYLHLSFTSFDFFFILFSYSILVPGEGLRIVSRRRMAVRLLGPLLLLLVFLSSHVQCVVNEANGGRGLVAPLHRHLTQRTEMLCSTDDDCLQQVGYDWCQRGIFCHPSDGHCHLIPHFPCERGELCNPEKRACERRQCRDWRDCNTESFCQGIERCVNYECHLDPLHSVDCSHGQCSESKRACITPLSLVNESLRVKDFVYNMHGSGGGGFSITDNHTNETPTSAPTEPVVSTTIWIFVGILAGVLVIILIVAIISAAYKPVNSVVVFDRTSADDNGQYQTQTFYNTH